MYISHFYAKSFNNFLICSPGENFRKIGPKIRDLAMSPPLGVPPWPLRGPQGYNHKSDPMGLGSWPRCYPGENLKVLAQKVKN